jgi:hypothetical protein
MRHPDLVEAYLLEVAAKLSSQWSELDRLRRAVEAAEGRSEPHANSEPLHAAATSSRTIRHHRTAGGPRSPTP